MRYMECVFYLTVSELRDIAWVMLRRRRTANKHCCVNSTMYSIMSYVTHQSRSNKNSGNFLVSSILSPSVPRSYTSKMPSYAVPNSDNSPIVSSREQSPEIIRTNTLAVTPLPRSFFQPVILELLRAHFSSFGTINQWVPLPGFARIIIVYEQEDYAENAKLCSDPIILSATKERYAKSIQFISFVTSS